MKKGLNRYVLADEIYSVLKDKILNHEIAPGEKINIDQLGRDLEVSNIPIRESLSRLSAEGLVETIPFKGMYVAKMSLQELDEIFEIRMELEVLAIRKSTGKVPIKLLNKLETDMNEWQRVEIADDDERIRHISEMNEGLHGLLLEWCGNRSLQSLIRTYIEKIQRYLSLSRQHLEQTLVHEEWEEHMLIIRELITGDTISAERALKSHLERSHARTRIYFE
ncbi:GntR family transcriptional regulator [Cohnella mopanensis]|uniref:GntR family transcriptional regulator n=1 Tax=Cohnella mopanensis TaxID=2911966 RepID=UPI001EF7E269|nr:GntR family transcriptional regulator [Cohnella mopanensis]